MDDGTSEANSPRKEAALAQTGTPDTIARAGAATRRSQGTMAARPAIIRYAGRHLGFLAGLLIVAVAIGIGYRYSFGPLDEQTVPFYIRSCIHAMGLTFAGWAVHLTFAGWAVHLTFAAAPRSRLGSALRRLPLSVEFVIKALAMTAVLTTVATGLEFVLYPFPLSRRWLADELPLIVGIGFSASLFVGAIFEFRRMIGGRVLGSFLLGTYHRPRRHGANSASSCFWTSPTRPRSRSSCARCAFLFRHRRTHCRSGRGSPRLCRRRGYYYLAAERGP
jgi:hypothetical protein